MEKSGKVNQPRKNFVKITGQLLYTEEQLQTFQNELKESFGHREWWLTRQLETKALSSFTIYAPKNVSHEEIIKEAFDKCDMARKEDYKFKLSIQSREEMWFEDLPYEMQKKFGACYCTTLSYLPAGIKCWKRWGRRSWDMLVPKDFPLDRGRRVQWEADQYFETWQIAKDTFFGNESESLKLRREAIAKEKEAIRSAKEKESAAIRQAHQKEVDEYNEKYRLLYGKTEEEYYKHPALGDMYINTYMPPELYTEERLKGTKYFIDSLIEEKKAKEEAEANRKMWEEKINAKLQEKPVNGGKTLGERAGDLGYDISCGANGVDICQSCYCRQSIKYSAETVFQINQFVTQKEVEREKELEEKRQQEEYKRQRANAESMGLPKNIRVWHRVGAGTNCGDAWVIKSDGSFREPTSFEAVKKYGDGYKNWEQILEGEVVLSWAKGCAAAEHEFEVIYMPEKGLTAAQKEVILSIEENIQEEWKNKRGLSSGISSPDVGMGWGIAGRKMPLKVTRDDMLEPVYEDKSQADISEETSSSETETDREMTMDDLMKLKDFFESR